MKRIDSIIAATNVEPRPYQRTICEKTVQMLTGQYVNGAGQVEPNARSILIESPTGSGKTVMGHLITKIMQTHMPDLTIGWVAMRRNLLSQAAHENVDKDINVENIHYVSMFDKRPEALIAAKKAGKPIMLVMDEAQHDAATSATHLHNLLEPDMIMGMTATPFRTDRMKLCFEKVVKDAGIHTLIQEGYLSQYHSYTIPKWDPESVADFYCQQPELWGKSIFYFLDLDQCNRFFAIVKGREESLLARLRHHRPDLPLGHGVIDIVTGSSPDREDHLERFAAGEVACLVNCMVLTEGFDEPTLETAFVRDSGKGPTMQMAGRAFRIHPEWKVKRDERFRFKRVVQSKQTRWPMMKTALAAQQYVWQNEDWRSLTVNPHLDRINHRARLAIAQTDVELPAFLTLRQKRVRRLTYR